MLDFEAWGEGYLVHLRKLQQCSAYLPDLPGTPSFTAQRTKLCPTSTRGMFHKTLWIHNLRICSYGQILTVNLLVNCQNSVIYGHFVVNYEEKSLIEQAPGPVP